MAERTDEYAGHAEPSISSSPSSDGQAARQSERPRLVLHVCCGPCATVALERLVERFEVEAYFYNPNLWPPEEYQRRLRAAQAVCEHFGVPLTVGPEDFAQWRDAVRGLEDGPEGGRRCDVCIAMRLRVAAEWAAERGAQWLTTTLTVGPQKRVERIHEIGRRVAEARGLRWLDETFRKRGGFQRSVEISRELELYRQDYCGCEFSYRERQRRLANRR